jgi:hypothetical protein
LEGGHRLFSAERSGAKRLATDVTSHFSKAQFYGIRHSIKKIAGRKQRKPSAKKANAGYFAIATYALRSGIWISRAGGR